MRRSSHFKKITAISLLAVLCIGEVELAACRIADPTLYKTIVTPVRQAASSTWFAVSGGVSYAWDKAASAVSRTAGDNCAVITAFSLFSVLYHNT